MLDNNFRFTVSSIPDGYELEHALNVFEILERRATSVDYAVCFSRSMDFLPKENALAVFYLLKRGNDNDKIRALRYIGGAFCIRIDSNFLDLIIETLIARDSSMPVRDAAVAAFVRAFNLNESSASETLAGLGAPQSLVEELVAEAQHYPNILAFLEWIFSHEPRSLCEYPPLRSFNELSFEGLVLLGITKQEHWEHSETLKERLPLWFEYCVSKEDSLAALILATAMARIGIPVPAQHVTELIPESVGQWSEERGVQAFIVAAIVQYRLLGFVPSLLAGLALKGSRETYCFASALVELDQSAEDMADVIVRGVQSAQRDAISHARYLSFALERDGERAAEQPNRQPNRQLNDEPLSPEQRFAHRAIVEALKAHDAAQAD